MAEGLFQFYKTAPSSERVVEYVQSLQLMEKDEFIDVGDLYDERKIVWSNIDLHLIDEVCAVLDEEEDIVVALIQDVMKYMLRDTLYHTTNLTRDTLRYELFPVLLFENERFMKLVTYLLDHEQLRFMMSLLQKILLRLQSYEEHFASPKSSDLFTNKWSVIYDRTPRKQPSLSVEDEVHAWLDYHDGETNVMPDTMRFDFDEPYTSVYDLIGPKACDFYQAIAIVTEQVNVRLKSDETLSIVENYVYWKQALQYVRSLEREYSEGAQTLYYEVFDAYLYYKVLLKNEQFNADAKFIFESSVVTGAVEKRENSGLVRTIYVDGQLFLQLNYANWGLTNSCGVSRVTIHVPAQQLEREAEHVLAAICLQELRVTLPIHFFASVRVWMAQISADDKYPSIELWPGIALAYVNEQLVIERYIAPEERIFEEDLPFGV